MTNGVVTIRSNKFKVKNEAAFLQWAQSFGLSVSQVDHAGEKYFSISTDFAEREDGWTMRGWDEESGIEDNFDLAKKVYKYLQDGSVVILMETAHTGNEGISGRATAVNSKGETESVYLCDIFSQIDHLGDDIQMM